jgi:hypothetical protein
MSFWNWKCPWLDQRDILGVIRMDIHSDRTRWEA